MRPSPLLIRIAIVIAISALLATVLPAFAWVAAGAFALLLAAAMVEALLVRRVRIDVERQAKLAVPLDEREEVTVRVRTNARRTLRLTVRQRWPEIVEPRSSSADALCRAGEVVALEFSIRGISRGTATVEPLYVAITMYGLVERIVPAGND